MHEEGRLLGAIGERGQTLLKEAPRPPQPGPQEPPRDPDGALHKSQMEASYAGSAPKEKRHRKMATADMRSLEMVGDSLIPEDTHHNHRQRRGHRPGRHGPDFTGSDGSQAF